VASDRSVRLDLPTGVSVRTRPRSLWAVFVLVAALLSSLIAVQTPPASAADGCVEVLPVTDIQPGDTGYGLTVSRGTEPEMFDVEVVDVLENALAPTIPLIVVEVDSPEIDRVGGIWAGMSGSPVYIDGKLIGAIAYGFSWSPSKLGGVTPAEWMLQVPDRPTLPPPLGLAEIELPAEIEAQAIEDGVSAAQAGTMRQLEIPVRVTGPGGVKFDRFAAAFEHQHPGTRVIRGAGAATSAASAEVDTIVPGSNLAVSLAYGDFTAMGVGTATTVCDGVVTAFGHPLMYEGATRYGMHGASAVRVVDDALGGPYKLANAGPPVGTIDQDRLAAVAGRLGALPVTTPITSTITNVDEARTVVGRTDMVYPDFLFDAVLSHGWSNYDALVFDDLYFSGTSEVRWTIEGVHRDGSPWSVTRENRHASNYDLSTESLFEVALHAQLLHDNPFEEVRVTSVDYEASAGAPYRALEILSNRLQYQDADGEWVDASGGILLVPGTALRLRIALREFRSDVRYVEVDLDIPGDAYGYGELEVSSGQMEGDIWECMWDPEACPGGPTESFDSLLDQIASGPRSDELTVTLRLYDDWYEEEFPDEVAAQNGDGQVPITAMTKVRLDEVVTGSAYAEAYVADTGGCPVMPFMGFEDVYPESVHALAIGCSAAMGITLGVSEDPPLYAPDRPVRRDQAASFISRLLDLGPSVLPPAEPSGFTDIDGNVHADAIERLTAAGIVRGRTPTTYDPASLVTRAQMATMLIEALSWSTDQAIEPMDGDYFWDVDPTSVHASNIDAAFELGLVQGYDDGSFRPGASTRRDQMATLMMRFFGAVMAG
jgi:hypothetical protein